MAPSADMIAVSASAAKPAGRPNAPAKASGHSSFSDLLAASDPAADRRRSDAPGDRATPDRATPDNAARAPRDAKTIAKGDAGPDSKKENKENKPASDDKARDRPETSTSPVAEAAATIQIVPQAAPAATATPQNPDPSAVDKIAAKPAPDPAKIAGTHPARAGLSVAAQTPEASSASAQAASFMPTTKDAAHAPEAITAAPEDGPKASSDAPAATPIRKEAAVPDLARQAIPAIPAVSHPAEPAAAKAAGDAKAPAAQAATEASGSLALAVKTAAAGTEATPNPPKPETGGAAPARKPAPASGKPSATQPLLPVPPEAKAGSKDSGAPAMASKASDDAKPVQAAAPDKLAAQQPAPQAPPPPAAPPQATPPAQNLLAAGLGPAASVPAPAAMPAATLHIATARDDAAPDLDALAVSVAARALSGAKEFEIRLDPPELGRVDVRLSIDASGKTEAHMTADQPRALDLLQKDAPALTQALRDAGLDVSQGGLNFSLRGQDRQGSDGGHGAPSRRANLTVTRVIGAAQSAAAVSVTGAAADARLDIHV